MGDYNYEMFMFFNENQDLIYKFWEEDMTVLMSEDEAPYIASQLYLDWKYES